jgi:segregation and condensation protein B
MSQLPDETHSDDMSKQATADNNPAHNEQIISDEPKAPTESVPASHSLGEQSDVNEVSEIVVKSDDASEAGEASEEAPQEASEKELAESLIETLDVGELKKDAAAPVAEEDIVVPDVSDLPPAELRAAVEAVLFVATKPMTIARLQRALPGTSTAYLEGFLTGLAVRYTKENRGWELRPIAGGWQLLTRRELYPWVRQLERKELPTRLSKSALETLAIVAYKQPITRGAIEDIRGVQCGPVLRQLMDVKLVQVTGRDEEAIGRPLLYGTTDAFLTRFGLGRVEDLPRRHEFGA